MKTIAKYYLVKFPIYHTTMKISLLDYTVKQARQIIIKEYKRQGGQLNKQNQILHPDIWPKIELHEHQNPTT